MTILTSRISRFCVASMLLSLAGCQEGGGSDKGAEEAELTEGKTDSFFSPTMHGTLGFALTNEASFSDAGTFHAWTFELDGEGTFTLTTQVSGNLDTVMYLYHRDSPDDSWGSFVEKNDDFEGNLFSQITFDGGPGEYRVLVKPFKQAMRGSFSVVGECDGSGCPDEGTTTCDPNDTVPLPSTGTLTEGCAERFVTTLASEVDFTSGTEVEYGMHCDLQGPALRGVQLYEAYWADVAGSLLDAFGLDPSDTLLLSVDVRSHDRAESVMIDAGGDEDAMSFVFTDDGPLMFYQHNQSPDVQWFCEDDGTPTLDEPHEDCVSTALFSLPHGDDAGDANGTLSVDEASGSSDELVATALARFASTHGLDDSEELQFDGIVWESLDFERAGELTVTHSAGTATYWVASDTFSSPIVIAERENGFRFVCD